MKKVVTFCKEHPYISVFLIAFLPRLLFIFDINTMSISGDEIFSFWPAAKLAGYDWSDVMEKYRYYGIGYTLLLAPFFQLIKNPVVLYRTLVILMALFQSLCAPLCCHLMRRFFHVRNTKFLILASTATVFMTPIRAVYTYPEFLYDLLIWVIVWILLKLSTIADNKKRMGFTILLWTVTGYACTVHTRGVTIVAAVLAAALIYQLTLKKKLLNWPVTIILAAAAILFYKFGISLLMSFLNVQHAVGNTSIPTGGRAIMLFLTEPKTWTAFAAIVIGQFNEAIMMSLGLAVPVTWAFAKTAFSKKEWTEVHHPVLLAGWFCIIALIITIGGQAISQASSVYEAMLNGGDWDAFRNVTYGRYFAAYAAPLLMVGLYLLRKPEMRQKVLQPALITTALLQGYFVFNIIPYINHFNGSVWSYAPFFFTRGFQDNISTAAYLAGTFAVFGLQIIYAVLSMKNRAQWILPMVCIGLIYVYGFNCLYHEGYRSRQNAKATQAGVAYLQTLPANTTIYIEDVPAGSAGQGVAWLYQFALPDRAVQIYKEEVPSQSEAVVVTNDDDDQILKKAGYDSRKLSDGWFVYERTGENS
ncbi:hypothetical protein [Faecalibaculum rodentium]|uniref:hypothetical protein n=2 Tax=Faecalibaculum rodentium TaxID=1702221 RepID=UPI0023F2D250|nr:hypothetical protein [Faecalibaculum rodentium]